MSAGARSEPEAAQEASDAKRNIALRLTVLARLMRNRFDREVAGLGVTRSQWSMIVVVARNPGATQRTIAEALEMSEASAGRLIDRLCAEGLLQRQERHDDRRARAVYLTKAAEPLLAQLSDIGKAGEHRIFRNFSEEDLTSLEHLLDRVYRNLA
jgi:DNA-binding MarR family transcriptional regulator